MRNRGLFVVAFLAVLFVAVGVIAQEQVGSIEGTIVDKDGVPLPGVTVEAVGPVGRVATTSGARGEYRFPRLPSGVYALTAKLDGFVPQEVPNINLLLGKVLKVSFTLQPGKFAEAVTVVADKLVIDVTQSSTSKSISREQIELIPRGRDFTAVVVQASGAANEAFAGGISVDGASGSENRFVIDGIDTSNPQTGVSMQQMVSELIEEVQVKSAGYAAEYGGSMGGVINAITKTGGNDYHGTVGFFYRNQNMIGSERPIARRDPTDSTKYDATTWNKDKETRWEPNLNLSGPVFRDKLWFFVAYEPALYDVTRTVRKTGNSFNAKETDHFFAANLKGNLSSKFLWKFAVNLSPSNTENVLPAKDGSTAATAKLDVASSFRADSYSLYGDYILSDKFLLSARVGKFRHDQHDSNYPNVTDIFFQIGNTGMAGIPTEFQNPSGWRTNPNNNKVTKDLYERQGASLDASWFVEAAGSHSFKFGTQYEKLSNSVQTGEIQNLMRYRWGRSDRFGAGVKGKYGSLEVRRFRTDGDVSSNNLGFFVQDSWSISKNFTVNVGVRTEEEKVPNYDKSYGEWAIKFNFKDKVAPRVGFAWDLTGEQRWKVYGSWGKYFDITKMELPRGSFGGDKWISYLYPLDTYDWKSLNCAISNNVPTDNPCPTLGTPVALNLREPSTGANGGIDPNIKPMQQTEWQIGLDHQLTPQILLGARYVKKHLVRTIEDMGFFEVLPDGTTSEVYTIGNPGEGVADVTPPPGMPKMPHAKREYQAFELNFARRFADRWMLNGSYTWSKLEGNYSGLASSDEFGRTSPNVNRFFDSLSSSFDEKGKPVYGVLNTDRTHQFKMQALYQFPFNLSVGLNQYVGSGTPISTRYSYAGVWFFAKGRNDQGRTPTLSQTDLMLTQDFKVGGMAMQASLNVINLFDQKIVTQVGVDKYDNDVLIKSPNCHKDQGCFFAQTPFDADAVAKAENNPANPFYLKPIGWQAPRTIRLGVKLTF